MSPITFFLFIISGVAILIVAFGVSRNRRKPSDRDRNLAEDMRLASRIAVAAASDAFGVELDRTEAGLVVLDAMINRGWSESEPTPPVPNSVAAIDESLFAVAAYVGELLVEFHHGIWRSDKRTHQLPFVYFAEAELAASPFDFVRRKFDDPTDMDMPDAYRRLVDEIATRKTYQSPPPLVAVPTSVVVDEPSSD